MRGLISVVVCCLVLGGCGEEPSAPAPVISPSPSEVAASPSGTPTGAPVLPEEAKANTKAGAVAFVKHYLRTANLALENGTVGELHGLGSTACDACNQFIANIEKVYSTGGRITGGTCSVGHVFASAIDRTNWQVIAPCSYQDQVTHAADGSQKHGTGHKGRLLFVVQFRSGMKVTSWSRV